MDVKRGFRGLEGHSSVVAGESLVIYGGRVQDREVCSDVFSMKCANSEWRDVRTQGYPPVGRCYHSANLYGGRMVVFGGLTSIGWDDVHYNHYNVFVSTTMIDPYERHGPGDAKFKEALNPIAQTPGEPYCYHELDLIPCPPVWTTPETSGEIPEPRSHHTAAVHDGKLYVYGGYNTHASQRLADERQKSLYNVYSLDLETKVWTRVECRASIPPILWGHSSIIADGVFFTFGGVDLLNNKEEGYICGWSLDSHEWRWMIHNDDRSMGPRAMHTAVEHRGRLVIFGGCDNVCSSLHDEVKVFDLESGAWIVPRCTGEAPTARRNHTAVVVGDTMIVTGGIDEHGFRSNRSYSLDLVTWTWTAMSTTFNDVPATSVVKSGDGYGPSDTKARQRLRRLHAKRKKEKADLLAVEDGKIKRMVTLQKRDPADDAPWEVDFSSDADSRPCTITAVRGDAEIYLTPGMRMMEVDGVPMKSAQHAQEALGKNAQRIRVVVEQREEDVPPSPPSSEDEGEAGVAADATTSDGPECRPRSDPSHYTQTPDVPRLSRDAALIHEFAFNRRADLRPGGMSPHAKACDELHTLDYNVFTASAIDPSYVKYRTGSTRAGPRSVDNTPMHPAHRDPTDMTVRAADSDLMPRVSVVAPGEEDAYRQNPDAPSFRPDLGHLDDRHHPRQSPLRRPVGMPSLTPPTGARRGGGAASTRKHELELGKYGYVESLPKVPERPVDEVAEAVKKELERPRPGMAVSSPHSLAPPAPEYKRLVSSGTAAPSSDGAAGSHLPPRGPDHLRLDDERLTAERMLSNASENLQHLHKLGSSNSLPAASSTFDPQQSLRAWNAFPSAPVKHQTNVARARYMSPSVIKLGMTDQLAANKPAALMGPFNGSQAARHPYGRSLMKDNFNLVAPAGVDDPLADLPQQGNVEDARVSNAQAADRYLTTVNTAIPAGLGPISAAAYLTGLYEKDGAYEKHHPEVLLARFPMDVRNAAAASYRGQWEHWSDRERLRAVRRYTDYQITRSRDGNDDLPPVLPPPESGADGLTNLPYYVARPSNVTAP